MNTSHGIGCRCALCQEYNQLSGEAHTLASQMISATKKGERYEADKLFVALAETNDRARRLKDELRR